MDRTIAGYDRYVRGKTGKKGFRHSQYIKLSYLVHTREVGPLRTMDEITKIMKERSICLEEIHEGVEPKHTIACNPFWNVLEHDPTQNIMILYRISDKNRSVYIVVAYDESEHITVCYDGVKFLEMNVNTAAAMKTRMQSMFKTHRQIKPIVPVIPKSSGYGQYEPASNDEEEWDSGTKQGYAGREETSGYGIQNEQDWDFGANEYQSSRYRGCPDERRASESRGSSYGTDPFQYRAYGGYSNTFQSSVYRREHTEDHATSYGSRENFYDCSEYPAGGFSRQQTIEPKLIAPAAAGPIAPAAAKTGQATPAVRVVIPDGNKAQGATPVQKAAGAKNSKGSRDPLSRMLTHLSKTGLTQLVPWIFLFVVTVLFCLIFKPFPVSPAAGTLPAAHTTTNNPQKATSGSRLSNTNTPKKEEPRIIKITITEYDDQTSTKELVRHNSTKNETCKGRTCYANSNTHDKKDSGRKK